MPENKLDFMHPYFLGAYAENDHIFENLLLEFVRDHAYWRRNFHPENRPPIPRTARYRDDFNEFLAAIQQELSNLSSDLKKSVPFFSPRYIGHMAADLLLPGVLAHLMTTLYNPNNVSDDAAPATLQKELEVGRMLARMLGFSTDPSQEPYAWGHLTSGGSVANYESLWNFRAVKYYPIAMAEVCKGMDFDIANVGPQQKNLLDYSKWELLNFSIRQTSDLMKTAHRQYSQSLRVEGNARQIAVEEFHQQVFDQMPDFMGPAAFFRKHQDLEPPCILVPTTGHYSWEKGAKILGFGQNQIKPIRTDGHMRARADFMAEILEDCFAKKIPVLAVVGILGTTEFGSVDPIHKVVALREKYQAENLFFGFHVDAAWGGYMASLFRKPDGSFVDHEEVRARFNYFPQEDTFEAFRAVSKADSVTVDPHKLGYLPFPCGAFISRDAGVLDFICQKAAYVFDLKEDSFLKTSPQKLLGLGQYIMEGSKPGSAAAAAYVAYSVLPLHNQGFGRVLATTMESCEYFFDKLQELKERLKNMVTLTIPFTPDTNLICYAINPTRNRYLALMNYFSRKVYNHMRINPELPLQAHDFFGSFTSLTKDKLEDNEAERILGALGIDPATYVDQPEDRRKHADHIYLIRHTLMNPWLLHKEKEKGKEVNYIDRYIQFLEDAIKMEYERAVRGRDTR